MMHVNNFLAIIVKEIRVYSTIKCLKNHCNHSFSQQCTYSYHCLLQRIHLRPDNNIENRYGKALIKSGKKDINIKKIQHSIESFRCFLTFLLIFSEVKTFFPKRPHFQFTQLLVLHLHVETTF